MAALPTVPEIHRLGLLVYAVVMPTWKLVANDLTQIEAALAAIPPNVAKVQQLTAAFIQKVKNRRILVSRAFTVDELKEAVKHLAFDMQHFRCYSTLYSDPHLRRFSAAASQAVMYALLLHLRLLIDFFYGEAKQDDCHVDHFNTLSGFEAAFPASIHHRSAGINKISANLNKFLAHMTATRWENNRPSMNEYEKVMPTIDHLIQRFEDALPEDLRQVYSKHYQIWEGRHPGIVLRQG